MLTISNCARKNAAFAMRYMLRMFSISGFKAKIVPINKISKQEVYYRR